MGAQKEQPLVYLEDVKNRFQSDSLAKKKAGLLSREDLHHDQQVLDTLEKYVMDLKKENVQDGQSAFPFSEAGLMRKKKNMTMVLTRRRSSLNMLLILWRVLLRVDRNLWYLLQN